MPFSHVAHEKSQRWLLCQARIVALTLVKLHLPRESSAVLLPTDVFHHSFFDNKRLSEVEKHSFNQILCLLIAIPRLPSNLKVYETLLDG